MKQYIFYGMIFGLFTACSAKTTSKPSDKASIDTEQTVPKGQEFTRDTVLLTDSTLSINRKSYKLNEADRDDKELVKAILTDAAAYNKQHGVGEVILFIAGKFIGKPYVSHTLDRTDDERMVINLQQLDCTTYLENVVALALASYEDNPDYTTFVDVLRNIRYRGGELKYENRLHYFDWWLSDNEKMGMVKEIIPTNSQLLMRQTLKINYMSENFSSYAMLKNHPERVQAIKKLEDATNGKVVSFIPKQRLNNPALRKVIKDGDLIALVTNKKNLDTTHLGFAVWKSDGLHLLNASSLKKNGKRVIEPTETLYKYLMDRSWNTGIRVARVCAKATKPDK